MKLIIFITMIIYILGIVLGRRRRRSREFSCFNHNCAADQKCCKRDALENGKQTGICNGTKAKCPTGYTAKKRLR